MKVNHLTGMLAHQSVVILMIYGGAGDGGGAAAADWQTFFI